MYDIIIIINYYYYTPHVTKLITSPFWNVDALEIAAPRLTLSLQLLGVQLQHSSFRVTKATMNSRP